MENKFASAVIIASRAHIGQFRSADKQPYLVHPLRVSEIINEWLKDHNLRETARICAVLHDVLEDSAIKKESLTKTFGKEIAEIVDNLSLDKKKERKKRNYDYAKVLEQSDDITKMIKLADIYDNSFDSWGEKDFTNYVKESAEIIKILEPTDKSLKKIFNEKIKEINNRHKELLKN